MKVGVRSMVTAKVGETMEKIEVGKGGRMREEVTGFFHTMVGKMSFVDQYEYFQTREMSAGQLTIDSGPEE